MKSGVAACAAVLTLCLYGNAQTEDRSANSTLRTKSEKLDCSSLMNPVWNANQRGAAQADCEFYNLSTEKGGDAWGEFASNDAALPRGKGKEEIRKASIALYARPGFRLLWKPDQAQPFGASFVVTSGRWERHLVNAAGKDEASHGRYVTVWQKQQDGSWRFVWDGGEADPAK